MGGKVTRIQSSYRGRMLNQFFSKILVRIKIYLQKLLRSFRNLAFSIDVWISIMFSSAKLIPSSDG